MPINPVFPLPGETPWGTKLNTALGVIRDGVNANETDITDVTLTPDPADEGTYLIGGVEEPYKPVGVDSDSLFPPRVETRLAGAFTQSATLDAQVSALIENPASAAASTMSRDYAKTGGLYLPTEHAMLTWRARRSQVLAGTRQGHIAVVGDSIAFGAAATGTTPPKYSTDWPGRLRALLAATYGDAGTGIVIADANVRANPTWDPRWAYTAGVTDQGFGFHRAACFRLDAVIGTYLEFAANCSEFVVYNLQASGGLNSASIDGGAASTFRNIKAGAVPDIERDTSYQQIVTTIPAGATGAHTLRIVPPTSVDTYDAFVVAVDARIPTLGTFRVSNPSINGKSLSTLWAGSGNNDETNGNYGLPLVDMLRADLLIIALGTNDWQGGTAKATVKSWLTTLVQRQRSTGVSAGGSTYAAGDALLVWNPIPNITALGESEPLWYEYRDAFYEVATEQNVALLDMGKRWSDYATANSLGLFADAIHPNDAGSLDIAPAVYDALMRG